MNDKFRDRRVEVVEGVVNILVCHNNLGNVNRQFAIASAMISRVTASVVFDWGCTLIATSSLATCGIVIFPMFLRLRLPHRPLDQVKKILPPELGRHTLVGRCGG
jgi:hypothetical protein